MELAGHSVDTTGCWAMMGDDGDAHHVRCMNPPGWRGKVTTRDGKRRWAYACSTHVDGLQDLVAL